MTTNTLTALNELADRIPGSRGLLADEPLTDTLRLVRAARVHVIVAFDGSPAGKDALALGTLLAGSAGSEMLVVCMFPSESLAGISFDPRDTRIANGDHRIFVRQDAEAVLGEARAALPAELAVTFRALECESALHGLRQLALSEDADVLVLGSTRRGRSDGCCIAAWPAACWEIRRVRSPSCPAVLAVVPDPCPDSPNAWPAAGGQPAATPTRSTPDRPKEGSD